MGVWWGFFKLFLLIIKRPDLHRFKRHVGFCWLYCVFDFYPCQFSISTSSPDLNINLSFLS